MPDVPNLGDLRTVDWSKVEPVEVLTAGFRVRTSPPPANAPVMGLPPGWVTNISLPRTAQLRALGNGVVPQQAAYAVSLLLADLATLTATERPRFRAEG
jgi:hypothetical protein